MFTHSRILSAFANEPGRLGTWFISARYGRCRFEVWAKVWGGWFSRVWSNPCCCRNATRSVSCSHPNDTVIRRDRQFSVRNHLPFLFFFGFAHANFDSYRPRHTSEAVSKLVKNLDYVSVVPVPGIRHMVCQVLHRGTYASLRLWHRSSRRHQIRSQVFLVRFCRSDLYQFRSCEVFSSRWK